MLDLKQIYGEKECPTVDNALMEEAKQVAEMSGASVEDALLYLLDMMVEKPFGE